MKKVVFLAPYGPLARQQWKLFLRQIDRLHTGDVRCHPLFHTPYTLPLRPTACSSTTKCSTADRSLSGAHSLQQEGTTKDNALPEERARWRVGLCVGGSSGTFGHLTTDWSSVFGEFQFLVMTPAQFEKALMHACVSMADIALLVLDEAHHTKAKANLVQVLLRLVRASNSFAIA